MWRTAKIFLLLVAAAFIAGLMPTIIDLFDTYVIYSVKEGFSLHPKLASSIAAFIPL